MSLALSPYHSLGCGFAFMLVILLTFYATGFYTDSTYFQWGPPITIFDHVVTSSGTFYLLLFFVFIHQLITNWIYEVVYPWIINTVQNQRQTTLDRSKSSCLAIVNFNALYNQLHLALIISGITSQISFLAVLVIADFITLSYINWHYIKDKTVAMSGRTDRTGPTGSTGHAEPKSDVEIVLN